jgi:BioD-like phosphotransacetylase family protein
VVVLYITSLAEGGGKTTVCAGLAQHLVNDGKKAGFLKPIMQEGADSDATLMKSILSLDEAPEDICPVLGDTGKLSGVVKQAYDRVTEGRDIVIIEGTDEANETARSTVAALDAKVIIVDGPEESPGDRMTEARKLFGDRVLGVVLNKVPASQVERVRSQAEPAFAAAGLRVLAVLPEDRALFTLTVGELAAGINGEILNSADKSEELAENFMLGAMTVDTGPLYFGIKENKVAVLKSERADMQLAALQTSTRCLVLSGEQQPLAQIMGQAEDKEVPIIMAKDDVATIVSNIEDTMARTRFGAEKLTRLSDIIEEHLDFPALYKGLGLDA